MIKVNAFVSILHIYIFDEFQVKALTQNFSLCHPHLAHGEHHVLTPAACVRHQQELIHNCSAQVLNSSNAVIKIPVYVCQIYITSWSSIYWFFSLKTHSNKVYYTYSRPREQKESVKNAMVTKIIATYNP